MKIFSVIRHEMSFLTATLVAAGGVGLCGYCIWSGTTVPQLVATLLH